MEQDNWKVFLKGNLENLAARYGDNEVKIAEFFSEENTRYGARRKTDKLRPFLVKTVESWKPVLSLIQPGDLLDNVLSTLIMVKVDQACVQAAMEKTSAPSTSTNVSLIVAMAQKALEIATTDTEIAYQTYRTKKPNRRGTEWVWAAKIESNGISRPWAVGPSTSHYDSFESLGHFLRLDFYRPKYKPNGGWLVWRKGFEHHQIVNTGNSGLDQKARENLVFTENHVRTLLDIAQRNSGTRAAFTPEKINDFTNLMGDFYVTAPPLPLHTSGDKIHATISPAQVGSQDSKWTIGSQVHFYVQFMTGSEARPGNEMLKWAGHRLMPLGLAWYGKHRSDGLQSIGDVPKPAVATLKEKEREEKSM